MAASGVCHSDLSMRDGVIPAAIPMILGHEGAGIVEAVGEGVDGVAPGDHVVISWTPQCGECYWCVHGQPYMCDVAVRASRASGLLDGTTRATSHGEELKQMAFSGTFAELTVVPAISVVKIPDDFPLRLAALLGCGVLTGVGAALNTADIAPGDSVAVIGCGGVGLNVIQGAAHRRRRPDHRHRRAAREARARTAVRRHPHDRRRRRPGRHRARGARAHRRPRRRRELRGHRARGHHRAGGQDDAARRSGRAGGRPVTRRVPRTSRCSPTCCCRSARSSAAGTGRPIRSATSRAWSSATATARLMLDELVSRTIDLDDVNDAFAAMERGEVARSVIDYQA